MSKILFLDLETTGFSSQWDYIIEIAAVLWDEAQGRAIDQFHEYIRPGKKIPPTVIELTGITNEQVACCRCEKDVLMDFTEWAVVSKPDLIVGHNCKAFDLRFIRDKLTRYHFTWNLPEIFDTLTFARQLSKSGKIKVANCKQPTLAEYYGIEYEAHSAIEDVYALIKLYYKMKESSTPTEEDLGF